MTDSIATYETLCSQFNQDFPPRDPRLGDRVRWWPHVTLLGTPASHAEWIDGLVTGRYHDGHLDIHVLGQSDRELPPHGPEIGTTPGTLVRCHRPYAPGEKMTDRHPDSVIAQIVEETIAAHAPLTEPSLQSIDDAPGTARRGAFDYDVPSYDGILKAPYEQPVPVITTCRVFHIEPDPPDLAARQAPRVADHQRREMQERAIHGAVHAAGARPDGFAQHQVDAAKAALLAPAPPRYPRGTR